MTVYIVTDGEYSDYHIVGVFSSLALAEACAGKHGMVEEWEVDSLGDTIATIFRSSINIKTGQIKDKKPTVELVLNGWRGDAGGSGLWKVAQSPVSQEHARKLAVEARQEVLRKKAKP